MLIERMLFTLLAFLLFIFIFLKMVKKNDTNYIAFLTIQALGIAISFIEIVFNKTLWIGFKILTYLMAIFLPILVLYLDTKSINIIEVINVMYAKLMVMLGNNKKAKEILNKIVDKYNNSYSAHKLLAEIYEKEGGMRKAIDEYVMAIDIRNTDYNSYYKISELLNGLSRKDEAITMLNNLLKIKPDYYKASDLLGTLLIEKEQFKEALSVYHDALRYNPNDYDIYYNLGIVYTRLNDFQNAKDSYQKAAEINHLKYNSNYSLGQIALIYRDIDAAEKYFTEALYGEEVEAMAYYELAKINMIKREKDKAIAFLEKAVELDFDYAKRYQEELIFVPIKAYIRIDNKEHTMQVNRKKLNEIEMKTKEHLDETYNVVSKLSDVDYKKQKEGKYKMDETYKGDEPKERS